MFNDRCVAVDYGEFISDLGEGDDLSTVGLRSRGVERWQESRAASAKRAEARERRKAATSSKRPRVRLGAIERAVREYRAAWRRITAKGG